jgi:DNA processing protein
MTGTAATKVTAAESVGAAETVGRKKMRETAETVTEEEKAYIHWLYQAVGVGSRGFLRSLATLGTPRELYRLTVSGALSEKVSERYEKKVAKMSEFSRGYDVAGMYGRMRERGIFLVTEDEPQFPERLSRIPDKPYALYFAGRLPQAEKRAVAVIGARECTAYGRYMAEQFGAAFAKAGIQVISGMARGIDGIGQTAALKEGGYSLGVLGCGVDICYPGENRELYETLLAAGGICSEYPPGTEPRAVLFPPRNRIISGLCDAVLVVEAREKSGTLITVDMALEQGREVYALPGRATDPLSGGCNRLIRQGAGLASSPEEVLEELMGGAGRGLFAGSKGKAVQGRLVFLEGVQGELWEILDFNPLPAQELQRRYEEKYGKTVALPILFKELLELCAGGYAGQVGGRYFMRICS